MRGSSCACGETLNNGPGGRPAASWQQRMLDAARVSSWALVLGARPA